MRAVQGACITYVASARGEVTALGCCTHCALCSVFCLIFLYPVLSSVWSSRCYNVYEIVVTDMKVSHSGSIGHDTQFGNMYSAYDFPK